MRKCRGLALTILFTLCLQSIIITHFGEAHDLSGEKTKLFIVYMGKNPHPTVDATHAAHHKSLSHVFESHDSALESLVYHYKHAFSGFSAMLTQTQADILSQLPEVVSVFESKVHISHTTRSFSYLGLKSSSGLWPSSSFGADVIIGVMDSGIWPESESFTDDGISEIPARWNGTCEEGELWDPLVHCNRKIIGARFFNKGYEAYLKERNRTTGPEYVRSARDMIGHGTHCASTAAGAMVENASFFGLASGTAVGGAPAARIAVYKVLWGGGSGLAADADLLAAFDQATLDGVDILSVSIGGDIENYYESSLAIGSYHANEHGILVSMSAGNNGPDTFTASNIAPWMLTVAASTTDRRFQTEIELGDGTLIPGRALKNFNFTEEASPIVDGSTIPGTNATNNQSRFCEAGSLNSELAAGRIVLCVVNSTGTLLDASRMEVEVVRAGGTGIIVLGPSSLFASSSGVPYGFLAPLFDQQIPAVGIFERTEIDNYLSLCSTSSNWLCSSTATIKRARTVFMGTKDSVIASFSSRGPNSLAYDILKPDVTAPGVDILAAWPEADTAMEVGTDLRTQQKVKFNVISGTSMSCPHVSGVSALIKSSHPDWSPAAIKSALMTTAIPLTRGTLLDYGAGEINVASAADPGLIYDLTPQDYVLFLCGLNYTGTEFEQITRQPISVCPNTTVSLNYPSISFSSLVSESSVVRTVTNVGPVVSKYNVTIVQPRPDMVISVNPSTLSFTKKNQKLSFTVTFRTSYDVVKFDEVEHFQGSVTWTDDGAEHQVYSPVSVWNF